MPFKINLGTKDGKTFKLECDNEDLVGKKIGEKLNGQDISADFNDYEFEIMGTSDKAGFPGLKDIDSPNLKRVLLTYGVGMNRKIRKEGKTSKTRTNPRPKGLRIKKSMRGNTISRDTIQINLKVVKVGGKKLEEMFPEQNKKKEEAKVEQAKPTTEVKE